MCDQLNMSLLNFLQSDLVIVEYSDEMTRDGHRQIMNFTTTPLKTASDDEVQNSDVVRLILEDYYRSYRFIRFSMLPVPNRWQVVFDTKGDSDGSFFEGSSNNDVAASTNAQQQRENSPSSSGQGQQQQQLHRKRSIYFDSDDEGEEKSEAAGEQQEDLPNDIEGLREAIRNRMAVVNSKQQQQQPNAVQPPPAPPASPVATTQYQQTNGGTKGAQWSSRANPVVQQKAADIMPWYEQKSGELVGKALRAAMAKEFDIDMSMCDKVVNRIRYVKKKAAGNKQQKEATARQRLQSEPASRFPPVLFDSRSNPPAAFDYMPDTTSDNAPANGDE